MSRPGRLNWTPYFTPLDQFQLGFDKIISDVTVYKLTISGISLWYLLPDDATRVVHDTRRLKLHRFDDI
jgi:hypothetical protein